MVTIYGIKNCDTMKKAFKYLEARGVEYVFHDYKKQGLDEDVINNAIAVHGWENVINRRGTTWRQLSDAVKETMSNEQALEIARDNPSIVKRPLLVIQGTSYLGFKEDVYDDIFA